MRTAGKAKKQPKKRRSHKKDFNWEQKKQNPFHIPDEESPMRQKMLLFVGALSLFATFGMLLYHPFFQISKISVHGLVRVGEEDFLNATHSSLYGNKYLIVPRSNYFFLDIEDISSVLKDRYVLEDIDIIETFPNRIDIAIQEKISTIIYDDGKMYAYMGLDGRIVEDVRSVDPNEWKREYGAVVTTTDTGISTTTHGITKEWHVPAYTEIQTELGDFPVVYDKKPQTGRDEPQYDRDEVSLMLEMQKLLAQRFGVQTRYIVTPDNVTATYITESGGAISIALDGNVDDYTEVLAQLAYTVDINAAAELDLRFGDRVFVR